MVGVVTIDVSSIGIKFENFMQAGCRDQGVYFAPWAYHVLPKAHYSAQTGTLFWNIFRIAGTPFHYLLLRQGKWCVIGKCCDRMAKRDKLLFIGPNFIFSILIFDLSDYKSQFKLRQEKWWVINAAPRRLIFFSCETARRQTSLCNNYTY